MLVNGRAHILLISACLAASLWVAGAQIAAASAPEPIPLAQIPYIFDIAVDGTRTANLLVATRGGLFRTVPGGFATLVSTGGRSFWNLALHPWLANRVYATGVLDRVGSSGIIISDDFGKNWHTVARQSLRSRYFRAIEIARVDPILIYALNNELWVSRNGGESWDFAGSPPNWVIDFAVSSRNPRTVYVGTRTGLLVSDDGGRSWDLPSATLCRQPITAVETGADGIVYAFSLCEGLLRGDERTAKWIAVNDDFGGCIVQHLAIDPRDSKRVYAVLRCNTIIASSDGGKSWREVGSEQDWSSNCPTDFVGRTEGDG